MTKYFFKTAFLFVFLTGFLLSAADSIDVDRDSNLLISPRVTALGMAGVALGSSAEAIFMNPALLVCSQEPNTYLSSYTLLEDVDNLNAAFTFPLKRVAFGVGYKSKKISGINVIAAEDIFNGRPLVSEVQEAQAYQDAYYFGVAINLVSANANTFFKNLNVGLAFKSIAIGASGADGLDDYQAYGSDLDLGLFSDLTSVWSLGINFRNFIDSSGGIGQIHWKNKLNEPLDSIVSVGNKFSYYDGRMLLLLDADFYQNREYPYLLHGGLEIWPYKYFLLRFGINQYPYPLGTSYKLFNAVTAGFAIKPFKGFNIEYAYYPGDDYALEACHYAGISFDSFAVFFPSSWTEEEAVITERFLVNYPHDYLVTEEKALLFDLEVIGSEQVTINGKGYPVDLDKNKLAVKLPLKEGQNNFVLEYKNRKIERNILKFNSFAEIKEQKQLKDIKKIIFTKDFVTNKFKPAITFQELANYIVLSLGVQSPEKLPEMFDNIDVVYLKGYLGQDDVFDDISDKLVLRGDLAKILARIEGYDYLFNREEGFNGAAEKAAQALLKTGYYKKADFYPLAEQISEKEVIMLLARTGAMSKVIAEYYQDFPLMMIDNALSGYVELYFINAEKFAGFDLAVANKSQEFSVAGQGNYVQQVFYNAVQTATVNVALLLNDRYGNQYGYKYQTVISEESQIQNIDDVSAKDGEEFFLVKTMPKKFQPGIKASVELAVPSNSKFTSVALGSNFISGNVVMNKNEDGIWSALIDIPAEVKPGNYLLVFNLLREDSRKYSKSYNIEVLGDPSAGALLPAKKGVLTTAQAKALLQENDVLVKAKRAFIQQGEYLEVYIGVLNKPEAVEKINIVLNNGRSVAAQKAAETLWVAKVLITGDLPAGKTEYKVFVKDKNDNVITRKRSLTISVPEKKAELPPQNNNTKVAAELYPAEVFIKPLPPKTGEVITFKVKIKENADKVTKVSAVVFGQTLQFKKGSSGLWVSYKTLPKDYQAKTIEMKIYAKDAAGKYTMTKANIKI